MQLTYCRNGKWGVNRFHGWRPLEMQIWLLLKCVWVVGKGSVRLLAPLLAWIGIKATTFIYGYKHFDFKGHSPATHHQGQ